MKIRRSCQTPQTAKNVMKTGKDGRNTTDRFAEFWTLVLALSIFIAPLAEAAKNQKPIANAGANQTVGLSTVVSLDGRQSTDPDGTIKTFQWNQTKGPKVKLAGAKTATPTFTSPATLKNQQSATLVYKLTVTDNKNATARATVTIDVVVCSPPKIIQNGACIALYSAQKIIAGTEHNCVLLGDNTVKCWGLNDTGQLGLGDSGNRGDNAGEMGDNLPRVDLGDNLPHFDFIGVRTAQVLAAGAFHTCAVLDDSSVKCWGRNDAGQLGLGDSANRGNSAGEMGGILLRVDLGAGHTAKALAVGAFHTCSLLDDNSVKCWGLNYSGRLGIVEIVARGDDSGEMGDNLPPVELGEGRTAKALAAGYDHTCALLDDNSVKCWGGSRAWSTRPRR